MPSFSRIALICAAGIVAAATIGATYVGPLERSDEADFGVAPTVLQPLALEPSQLTVAGPDGAVTYSGESLEALGTYALVTTTPWRETPATFEGVLLSELLEQNGLANAPAIEVTAENDYTVVIERDVWTERPALIATRVDGAPHTREARGPLQFVFPMDADPETAEPSFEGNWVWLAARIAPFTPAD